MKSFLTWCDAFFFFGRKPDRRNKRKSYPSIFRYVWLFVLFKNNQSDPEATQVAGEVDVIRTA